MVDKSTKYLAINLPAYNENLELKEFELRELKKDEVLVKMIYSTFLPSDLGRIKGIYGATESKAPFIPGNEGCGIIEKVADNLDTSLLGKHVSIVGNSENGYTGVWSQFTITKLRYLLVFDTKIDFEKIFSVQINPLTAVGFLDTVRKSGKKSVAQNGASSALGRLFMRLCIKENIEILNIVRKEETIKEMTELGGKNFVNTSDKDWVEQLKKKSKELDISILIDCVGGSTTGKCLSGIQSKGTLYHMGNLELSNICDIESKDLIFHQKTIKGWWLPCWLQSLTLDELVYWKNYIKEDIEKNKGEIFSTEYSSIYSLKDFHKALEEYSSKGKKVLIKFWE